MPTAAADLHYRATPTSTWRWRFIGDTVYGTSPDPAGVARAVAWTHANLAQPAAGDGSLPANPVDLLHYLSASLTSVSATSIGVLDRVAVTRYDGTAELIAAAAAAPAGGPRIAVRHLQTATGSDHLFVQEWIDGDGRIRRLTYTAQSTATVAAPSQPLANGGDSAAVTVRSTSTNTMTLTQFGVPAAITAPPTNSPTN